MAAHTHLPALSPEHCYREISQYLATNGSPHDNVTHACIDTAKHHDSLKILHYDTTTIAFATYATTHGRAVGYSKTKSTRPQLVLSLAATTTGIPVAYDIFDGDTSEAAAFPTAMKNLCQLIDKRTRPIIIADSYYGNRPRFDELEAISPRLYYILGARASSANKQLAQFSIDKDEHNRPKTQLIDTCWMKSMAAYIPNYLVEHRKQNKPYDGKDDKLIRVVWQWRDERNHMDLAVLQRAVDKLNKVRGTTTNISEVRFLTAQAKQGTVNNQAIERARATAGWKGCYTNIPARKASATDIAALYNNQVSIERCFRALKDELGIEPVRHHDRETMGFHFAVKLAALLASQLVWVETGVTMQKIIGYLRRSQHTDVSLFTTEGNYIFGYTAKLAEETPEDKEIKQALAKLGIPSAQ